MPAIARKTACGIFTAGEVGTALDGDSVAVKQVDKFPETEMPGEGCGLVGDSFHQVSIADEGIGKVVNQRMFRCVEAGSQKTFREGEADGICGSLSQGACRCFNTRSIAVFGVSRGHRAPLPEIFQFLQGDLVTTEMEHGVDQHGAMSG